MDNDTPSNQDKTSLFESIAVLVFVSMIGVLFFVENSTTLAWTVLVPLLPILFLIIGFSRWRNICPLAYFSKISQKLSWIKKRKVPQWFEDNFYLLQYFLLFVAFSLRLIVLNFNNVYLGIFFILTIVSAFVVNLVFTGKSWCNFFCPVGVVERIYCVSNAHKYNIDSACSTCTACKKDCPDIDMESNYWRENTNSQKNFVFYSFSGLVFGFYMYFYLQSGSFDNYFSGAWTNQYLSMYSSGFYFAPFIPLFIAAPLTLAFFTLLSFFIFKGVEKYLLNHKIFPNNTYEIVSHRVKVIASFVAFNTFYIFAGAPSYMQYPVAYAMFYFLVVALSSTVLYREFFREEEYFVQERFALKMINKLYSARNIPKNLKEIYYTHINAMENKKEKLETYKETITDLLNDGILTASSMALLVKLREQMGITDKDHIGIMKVLKIDHKELFDRGIEKSSERRYQRSSYAKVLEEALSNHTELTNEQIDALRGQFAISSVEHKEIMDSILNSNDKLHEDVMNLLKQMNALRRLHKSIHNNKTKEVVFLKYVIRNEFNNISKAFFSLLLVIYKDDDEKIATLKNMFKYENIGTKIELARDNLEFMDEKIASAICELKKDFDNIKKIKQAPDNRVIVKYLMNMDSMDIATAALLVARDYDEDFFEDIDLTKFITATDRGTQELVHKILAKTTALTTYEEMMYLHTIPLFKNVKFYDLQLLARLTKVLRLKKDEYIIKQGEAGNTLFIIIEGKVDADTDGVVVNTLGSQEYFGAVALLGDITRTMSVKVVEDVTLLTLSKEALKKFMSDNPEVSAKVMKTIIRRLLDNKTSMLKEGDTSE